MLFSDTRRAHAQGAESDGPRMHRSAALHFHNEAKPCRVWRGPETFAVLFSFAIAHLVCRPVTASFFIEGVNVSEAAVTCAAVQPVVSSLTFTDKRGMLERAFSVAFAGSGRPQGVFA